MNWFRNFNTLTKIVCLLVFAAVFMVITGYTGYYFGRILNNNTVEMYGEHLVPVRNLNDMRVQARANTANQLKLILMTSPQEHQEILKDIQKRDAQLEELLARYEKTDLDAFEKENLALLKKNGAAYRGERQKIIDLALAGKAAEAYALYKATDPLFESYQKNIRDLADYNQKHAKEVSAQGQKDYAFANKLLMGIPSLALLLVLGMGWLVARMIANPLKLLVTQVEAIAGGDLSERERASNSRDEVGRLAEAVAQMRGSLHEMIKKVSQASEQVAASSEELTASSEQSAQASNQIASSITDVANGATEQLAAANETSAVVEQMSAGIQQVAANTNNVAEQSARAAEMAKEGDKAAEKAVSQMVHIEDTVNTSAQVVAKLGERSKEIGQIVDTIAGIAGQTNLLALNAAIEAARAGEQGRGFAVVAEEVRKLAEQSQEAAKKIAELIGEIQGDTDKAVVAMNEGTQEVKTGAEVVNAAGVAFQEIVELVSQVSSQVREISAAIQQMASGSQQIVGSVRKIDTLSKKSAGEAQSVSAATEEQLASMEEIATSSEALAKLAQELQATVAKFRV